MLVVYEALQLSYCVWLKHMPVIDIVVVSSGFLLRAIAGAVAVQVPLSQWFCSLPPRLALHGRGKRYSEKLTHADGTTRRSLSTIRSPTSALCGSSPSA